MTVKKYTVKPLVWEDVGERDFWHPNCKNIKRANAFFGVYYIYEDRNGNLKYEYSFDREYDEEYFPCESVEEGMKAAEADWAERMSNVLVECD